MNTTAGMAWNAKIKLKLWLLWKVIDYFLSRQYLLKNLQMFEDFVTVDAKNVALMKSDMCIEYCRYGMKCQN